jgi:hypothetical protein
MTATFAIGATGGTRRAVRAQLRQAFNPAVPCGGPYGAFDADRVPPVFIAAAWHTLLGESGATYRELSGGDLSSGIALVRF